MESVYASYVTLDPGLHLRPPPQDRRFVTIFTQDFTNPSILRLLLVFELMAKSKSPKRTQIHLQMLIQTRL